MSGRIMSDTSEFAQAVNAAASLRDVVSTALDSGFQPPTRCLAIRKPQKKHTPLHQSYSYFKHVVA